MKKTLAPHRSPKFSGPLTVERQKIVHGVDAFLVEPLLRARADAGQIAEREPPESFRQNVKRERHQAVGLFHIAGHFGEIAIGGQAYGAAQHLADALADSGLYAEAEVDCVQQRALAAHQAAGHLVDGADGRDRHAAFDGLHDAVMEFGVELVAAFDQHDLRTHAFGVGDNCPGANAEGLSLVTCGNAAGCIDHCGHDPHWPAAKLGPQLLLDRGKVGIQVDEEPVEQGPRSRFRP